MNYNKVMMGGNLTRDPELRHTSNGSTLCKFGLAVNEQYTGSDGTKKQRTCFIDVVAWNKAAEMLAKYFTKGKAIFIEGRLEFQTWDGPDGSKRSKHELVVEQFKFVGSKSDEGGGTTSAAPDRDVAF